MSEPRTDYQRGFIDGFRQGKRNTPDPHRYLDLASPDAERRLAAHTPWAKANFDGYALWLACSCGWNMDRAGVGNWNDHFLAALRETP